MPGKKTTRAPAAQSGNPFDNFSAVVTRLHAKLEEAQERADQLHHKAERLHAAVDKLQEETRNRPPMSKPKAAAKTTKHRKAT